MQEAELEALWSDPTHWSRWGIYRCAADPRLVVPKPVRWSGWTLNFARAGAIPLLVLLLALAIVPTFVVVGLGFVDPLIVGCSVVFSAAAVILLTLALNRRGQGKTVVPRALLPGRIPKKRLAALEAEGIVLLDEGVRGTVTFRNFRAPGKRFLFRRNWFTGSMVITRVRFAAFTSFRAIVDVPLQDDKLALLSLSLEGSDTLCIAFDPAVFDSRHSGAIEYRLKTAQARSFLERLGVAPA